jgi:protein dispatched 1
MFLTTLTTAVAFFSTAICPVAPITMFAIFCGLLIVFDYVMNVVLIFPALCIWDRSLQANGIKGSSCFILCSCFGLLKNKDIVDTTTSDGTATTKELALDDDGAEDLEATTRTLGTSSGRISIQDSSKEEKPSLTTRIFTKFYDVVHVTRWPLLVACMAALSVCIYYSTTLQLPLSSDVRLLNDKEQFEQNYLWRQKLLVKALEKSSGSQAYMLWGLKPADTGDHSKYSY